MATIDMAGQFKHMTLLGQTRPSSPLLAQLTPAKLCYTNSTELLFATMTIYHMRIIERLWGSTKFAVYFVLISIC